MRADADFVRNKGYYSTEYDLAKTKKVYFLIFFTFSTTNMLTIISFFQKSLANY